MVPPNDTRQRRGLFRHSWVWVIMTVAVCAPWFNIVRDNADSAGMLAHLHGLFVDVDALYDNEYAALRVTPTFAFVTGEGVVSNHWPSGASWLQAPGYGLGLLAARLLDGHGPRFDPMGAVVVLSIRVWAMLVLASVLHAIARASGRAAGSSIRGAVVASLWMFGTPLLYYASEAPLRPHLWGFTVMAVFVLAWHARDWGSPLARAVVLGALVGLAASIRPQLAPAWLLVAEDVLRTRDARIKRWVVAGIAASAWPLLHLRVQVWMYGGELGGYGGDVTHHLRAFLFSPYHGALVWSPLLVLGLATLIWAALARTRGGWLLLALFVHQVWLDSGMRDISAYSVLGTRTWSGGTSFGARKLLDALPLLLPSSLALLHSLRSRPVLRRGVAAVAFALAVPSTVLLAAAFVDPSSTGALLDWRGLGVVLGRPMMLERWLDALHVRAVPFAVFGVVSAVVVAPLVLARARCERWIRPASSRAHVGLAAGVLVGGALVAHVWLSVVLVRSDIALAEDPSRMVEARAAMHPAHEATVRRIAHRHAAVRALLGEHAAPPP